MLVLDVVLNIFHGFINTIISKTIESMAALALPTSSNNYDGLILRGQRKQSFALPKNIIYYMAMNPSTAKVYMKLVRACKFFYNINPILVVAELSSWEDHKTVEYVWKVSAKKLNASPKRNIHGSNDGTVKIDMNNVPLKIWITESIALCTQSHYEYVASVVHQKVFRCDATYIGLYGLVLTLDEFLLLSSKAKDIEFWCNKITENDGKNEVLFEKIIEKLPNLREVKWDVPHKCYSANTVKELIKIPHFGAITSFILVGIPGELFDAKTFFDYIKTQQKHMDVSLDYDSSKITDKIKKQIDEIIDEMYNTQVFTYKPPHICYRTLSEEKGMKLLEVHKRYAEFKTHQL